MKRLNGEGSVYQLPGGRWQVKVYTRGKPVRRNAATKTEAMKKLRELHAEAGAGTLVIGKSPTVAEFAKTWLEQAKIEFTTKSAYQAKLNYALPVIGTKKMKDISPALLDRLFADLLQRNLSGQTVSHVRAVLRSMFGKAHDWGKVTSNPVEHTDAIPIKKFQSMWLRPDDAAKFLHACESERLGPLFALMLLQGLRVGEALALRWRDFDLDRGVYQISEQVQRKKGEGLVFKQLKTEASAGDEIPLAQPSVKLIRAWRAAQGTLSLDGSDLLFATNDGKPLSESFLLTSNLTKASNGKWEGPFRRICNAAGIAYSARGVYGLRIHDLRHSTGSLLHGMGVDVKTISSILRHSRVQITQDRYIHVMPEVQREAIDKLGKAVTR